jgi:hypothetical protein
LKKLAVRKIVVRQKKQIIGAIVFQEQRSFGFSAGSQCRGQCGVSDSRRKAYTGAVVENDCRTLFFY